MITKKHSEEFKQLIILLKNSEHLASSTSKEYNVSVFTICKRVQQDDSSNINILSIKEREQITDINDYLPETEIMDYLLSLNKGLTETYKLYKILLYCCKINDFETFLDLILLSNDLISDQMVTPVKTLKKHPPRIKNTFRFPYSNGPLEGLINKTKLIKQIAYGYRNFQNYKYRILLSFKDKQISNEKQLASVA